jgi:uncharacterized membrane protein
MLTDQDRRLIRAGAMKRTGERHSRVIFWALVLPRLLAVLIGLATVVAAIALLHSWWVGSLGPWLHGDAGALKLALITTSAVFVVLALRALLRPRGHARRGHR